MAAKVDVARVGISTSPGDALVKSMLHAPATYPGALDSNSICLAKPRQTNQRVATNEIAISLTAYTLDWEVGLEEEVLVVDKR